MSDRLDLIDRDWRNRFDRAGVRSCDDLREVPPTGASVAESRTTRTEVVEIAGTSFHRKIYFHPTPPDRWRGALRGTLLGRPRARREWDALRALIADGLPAVEPIALGVIRRRGFVRLSLLLTRTVQDAVPLDRLSQLGENLETVLERFAHVLARVHEAGHRLGRPALRDVLAVPDETDPGVRLLDLPRHRRGLLIGVLEAARDLARFHAGLEPRVSRPLLLEFFEVYARQRVSVSIDRGEFLSHLERESGRYREGEGRRIGLQ